MIFFNAKAKNKVKESTQTKRVIAFSLHRKNAWLLWLCQCLNIAVIALELSTWLLAIISVLLAWQAFLLHNNKKQASIKAVHQNHQLRKHLDNQLQNQQNKPFTTHVSSILLTVFAVLGCIVIAIKANQVGILASMVHLLCFSYVLKAFELKNRRDFYQLFLLGLFVLASALIFRQNLTSSLITLALLIINLAVLLQLFTPVRSFFTHIKVIIMLLAQSVLLAVVLFLVFPRLSPLWQVPLTQSAETGLSDRVKPGDIANLSRSSALAFRADFGQQAVPPYSQLYWRAMVLENFDGKQWTRNKLTAKNKRVLAVNSIDTSVTALSYQITVEPSFQRYLFTLAPAISDQENKTVISHDDYTVSSEKTITQAKSYQLTSYLSAPLTFALSKENRLANLYYPQGSNPKLEQLALQLQHNYPNVQARAQAVLARINTQSFSYTLQPPLLINNSLDQFFFETQAGFCVHYASAFTFIMRASGIPARLVTGYLGGEYNGTNNILGSTGQWSSQGHLSIYQYDAHAWSEIWVAGKGWLRIDPTSAVDPQRINSGWSRQLLQEQSLLNQELFSLYQLKNIAWLNTLRLQFDALDYQWTRWVIGFTRKQQTDVFKRWFGHRASWKTALILTLSLLVSVAIILFSIDFFNRPKRATVPLKKWQLWYQKALTLLANYGLEKPAAMTVTDFTQQVQAHYPRLAIAFSRLSASYNRLCYQSLSTSEQAELLLVMQQQYHDFVHLVKSDNHKAS